MIAIVSAICLFSMPRVVEGLQLAKFSLKSNSKTVTTATDSESQSDSSPTLPIRIPYKVTVKNTFVHVEPVTYSISSDSESECGTGPGAEAPANAIRRTVVASNSAPGLLEGNRNQIHGQNNLEFQTQSPDSQTLTKSTSTRKRRRGRRSLECKFKQLNLPPVSTLPPGCPSRGSVLHYYSYYANNYSN